MIHAISLMHRFTYAMLRALGALFRRQPVLLSPGETTARVNVCAECIFFNSEFRTCRKCDCLVDVKALLATEVCPQNYWP